MTREKLVEGLAEQINRRTFLVKVGTATVAALLGLMGLSQTVLALDFKCCHLC